MSSFSSVTCTSREHAQRSPRGASPMELEFSLTWASPQLEFRHTEQVRMVKTYHARLPRVTSVNLAVPPDGTVADRAESGLEAAREALRNSRGSADHRPGDRIASVGVREPVGRAVHMQGGDHRTRRIEDRRGDRVDALGHLLHRPGEAVAAHRFEATDDRDRV